MPEFAFVESSKGCFRREEVQLPSAKTEDEDKLIRAQRRWEFETAVRQLVMEFDAADLDRNRSLSFREFSEFIRTREMGVHSENSLRARFNELDVDGSGTLEMHKFIRFALRDALSRCAALVTDLLAEWDVDGDGVINVDEFRKAVRQFGFEAKNDEIDAVFRDFDTDGDGTLSLEELSTQLGLRNLPFGVQQRALRMQSWRIDKMTEESLKNLGDDLRRSLERAEAGDPKVDTSNDSPMLAKVREKRAFELRVDRMISFLGSTVRRVMDLFRIMDQDGDGLLQKKELKVFFDAIGFEMTPKDVGYIFAKLDKDGGGTIDFKELNRALQRAPTVPGMEKEEKDKKHRTPENTLAGAILKTLKGKISEGSDVGEQVAAALAANWSKVTTLFHEFDADGSGNLSHREMREALGLEGIGISRRTIDELFSKIDKDGSGEISIKEFAKAIRPSAAGRGSRERLDTVASLLSSPLRTRMLPRQRCMSPAPRSLGYPLTPLSMQLPPLEHNPASPPDTDPFPPPPWGFAPGSAMSTAFGPLETFRSATSNPLPASPPRTAEASTPERPGLMTPPWQGQRSIFVRPASPQKPQLQIPGPARRLLLPTPWNGRISPPGTPGARVSRQAEEAWWLSWLSEQAPRPRPRPDNILRGSQSMPVLKRPTPLQPSQAEVRSTVKSPADVAGSGEGDFVTGMRYNAAGRDAFDANDDKKLDFDEFCAFLRDREQGNIPDAELRSRFDALDENGNGLIDMDEYLQWSLKDALSRSSSRVVDLFRAWDEDQSGSVDKREFYKAVKALGFDIRREDTDAVFDSLDEDRSGKLEYAELNKMLRKGVGSERTKRNLKRAPTQRETGRYAKLTAKNMNANYVSARLATLPATVKLTASSGISVQEQLRIVLKMHGAKLMDLFREWDDDGNGAVDKHEFQKAVAALGYDAPKSEIDALFNRLDEDGSGWIEYHELKYALSDKGIKQANTDLTKNGPKSSSSGEAPGPLTSQAQAQSMPNDRPASRERKPALA